MLVAEAVPVLEPQITLNAVRALLFQITELPQTTEVPLTSAAPQTIDVPHTTEVPQTTDELATLAFPYTIETVPLEAL